LWGWANMKQTGQGGTVEAWTDFFSGLSILNFMYSFCF